VLASANVSIVKEEVAAIRSAVEGKRVVIVIAEGYHEHEFWYPYYRFREAGVEVAVAGPEAGTVLGEGRHGKDGLPAKIEVAVADELAEPRLDLLYLPGGVWSPMRLRAHEPTLALVRWAMEQNKLVAAICHATWILASAGVLAGRAVSCPRDMAADARNAGAVYSTEKCVVDGNLITAEYYAFLPEHLRAVVGALGSA
jgi:protease I